MHSSYVQRPSLRTLLNQKRCLRVLEAHSPISALLAQHASVEGIRYDAIWSSSLTDSTHRGLPDIEILSPSNRLQGIHEIFSVCNLPLIFDADTGGRAKHFSIHTKMLDQAGVSAVIIEDKCGLKKNSLLGTSVFQTQDSIEAFNEKIKVGLNSRVNPDFMIIARCESLILDKGMNDALERCTAYIDAGADGIMIHSRKKDGLEIIEFSKQFRKLFENIPLICVPTSYVHITFEELEQAGFNVVIYANHMLRSSYLAMKKVAYDILLNGRTLEVEPFCLSIDEILHLIPDPH